MEEKFKSIGAHWYSRKQTLGESIEDILQFILELEKQNPELFGKWFKKEKSKKDAMTTQFTFNYNNIKNEIAPKLTEESFPETAFNLSVWNGKEKDEESMSLSFSLGSEEAILH